MGYYKTTIRKSDTIFSNYIRQKAGWRCEKCAKICRLDGVWLSKLEASHYFGRGHENTRFDTENVYSLCFNCHKRMGGYQKNEQGEYDLWVKGLLGEKRYYLLMLRSNQYKKRDDWVDCQYVKILLKELSDER